MSLNPVGFVIPAATIGLGALLIRPRRGFFSSGSDTRLIPLAQATIEEVHHDKLDITEHPVEQGATISDHAYKRPAEVVIFMAWSDSPSPENSIAQQGIGIAATLLGRAARVVAGVAASIGPAQSLLRGNSVPQSKIIYNKLLALQESRVLFDIYTGKRVYNNMLFESLNVTTDVKTENALFLRASCKQVIIVNTQTVQVPVNIAAQSMPEKTTPVQNTGRKLLQDVEVTIKALNPFDNITGVPIPP